MIYVFSILTVLAAFVGVGGSVHRQKPATAFAVKAPVGAPAGARMVESSSLPESKSAYLKETVALSPSAKQL